ncbi:Fis family transcriptional regulator [Simiduia sp. 21SJ11W-1]|uniref:Fis family transcriptional regulator n=1 Tax=Simiduia sp. 21SJ11W-1 TaxID=2909669 RepID=UPI0020A0622F|nr:Fis family transcriptional regulator [Simiduia sp. 21SJ11W-1]UTA48968.1 Fis family transcriptional regulator [Simiduia sp. 21SJ11W-1]
MRKTHKKIDNAIRIALTGVCESALKKVDGFQWLTHLVDYGNFPQILAVVCIFENEFSVTKLAQSGQQPFEQAIISALNTINIPISVHQITFTTEHQWRAQH